MSSYGQPPRPTGLLAPAPDGRPACESLGIPNDQIWVSFDRDVDPITRSTKLIRGEWVTNPGFNQRQSDLGDLAFILLSKKVGTTPASLPTERLCDAMCLATNTTLQLDTRSARAFLGQFVVLP
jgi:hypothetical protein